MNESSKATDHGTPEEPHGASPESVEPAITEPELGTAEISEDVAETVDLEAAAAEAAAVEHEAELAAQNVSSDLRTPGGRAAGSGVEPTDIGAGAAGEESAGGPSKSGQPVGDAAPGSGATPKEPGHIGPGVADGHGWRRAENPWEQSSTPWKPKGASWQSPSQISRNAAEAAEAAAEAAGSGPATDPAPPASPVVAAPAPAAPAAPAARTPEPSRASSNITKTQSNPKKILVVAGIVLVGVALLVAFIMLLVGLFSGSGTNGAGPVGSDPSLSQQSLLTDPGNSTAGAESDLIVAEVSPLNWLEGDCLRGFKDNATPADVVLCSSPHNAQLVGAFFYKQDEAFPGVPALQAKAAQVCKGVQFTAEASALTTLQQTPAYPSESTWKDQDDRRVDCMVHDTRTGNLLETTLTQ